MYFTTLALIFWQLSALSQNCIHTACNANAWNQEGLTRAWREHPRVETELTKDFCSRTFRQFQLLTHWRVSIV